jgi:aminopeptidase
MPSAELLERYAEVAIGVGINVEPGDRVVISSPIQLPELTRIMVEKAYDRGAHSVDLIWTDEVVERARFSHGPEQAASAISGMSKFRMSGFDDGASYLRVHAVDPSALAGVDTSRVQEHQRVNGQYLKPHFDAMGALKLPWCVIGAPVPAWNASVFPGVEEEEAAERMWDAIFRACRIDRPDPVGAWHEHLTGLSDRAEYLSKRRFTGLRYQGPGTDLVLGLTDRALWKGGTVRSASGRPFAPNLPTEEVFTSPHMMKAEGRVQATKPLSYFGDLIEGFSFELSDGKIVSAEADRGRQVLDRILGTDEGSVRLGEAAMVPQSGAVAAEGLVWNNTLYDENDACHIAIGQSYATCYDGASGMSADDRLAVGLNQSSVHVDFVLGSPQLQVFGVHGDGSEEPIMANGEWAFSA